MAEQQKSFWSSMPGVLTGIAAIITALTGLYLAVNGNSPASPTSPERELVSKEKLEPQSTTQPPDVVVVPKLEQGVAAPIRPLVAFPKTGPLVECALFPTVNTVDSLLGWSSYYQKQIVAAGGVKRRSAEACNRAIDYRGMAHCSAPGNLDVRQQLLDTLVLCREVGIEWQDIQHSTILGQE